MSVMTPEGAPRGWSPANPEIRVSIANPNPYDGISDQELRLLGDQLFEDGMFTDCDRIALELTRRLEERENN